MMGRLLRKKHAAHRGFSLIEMMMVISILSLISSIILASLVTARDRARVAKAKAEMRQMTEAMMVAQGERNTTLVKIINSNSHNSTDHGCQTGDISQNTNCISNWFLAVAGIGNASGGLYTYPDLWNHFKQDPWGMPYVIRARQGFNDINCDVQDQFLSAGPDRTLDTADDVLVLVPLSSGCP